MSTDNIFHTKNRILGALPAEDLERLEPMLERVTLASGDILFRPDERIEYVYFPDRSMISVVAYTETGQAAEAAVIGSEGAAGLDVILGSDSTINENITQLADSALRIKTADIRAEFARGGVMHDLLLSFTRKLLVQMSQTVLCNRLHTTENRLSRWLLMCRDRSESDVLRLTQEFISIMLGASRTTVTLTAIELQNLGLISYSRGIITIVDRAGLEAYTCSCYGIIRRAYGFDK